MYNKIIVGNWKMNLDYHDSLLLAKKITTTIKSTTSELVICPSFLALAEIGKLLKKSFINLGAQDVFWQQTGAYTGEISPKHLYNLGVRYAIIGHSERRGHLGETNDMINRKVLACLSTGITPIVCVGETRQQKEADERSLIIKQQVSEALSGLQLDKKQRLIFAYEPIWAIGTGYFCPAIEADDVQQMIRVMIRKLMPDILDEQLSVLYGGSVNAANAKEFLNQLNIDGLLIGGASLKIEEFAQIVAI